MFKNVNSMHLSEYERRYPAPKNYAAETRNTKVILRLPRSLKADLKEVQSLNFASSVQDVILRLVNAALVREYEETCKQKKPTEPDI